MARIISFTWMVLAVAIVQAKPLDSSIDESINEVDHDNVSLRRKEQARNSALPTNEEQITATIRSDATNSAAGTVIDATVRPTPTIKPGPFSWFLTPLTQNIQFSPQSLLQDRLLLLKEAFNKLGINPAPNATAKQLGGPSGLLHFVGPNDTGFYTNRLEPAGFLGGNGWFANKGGILGGPGAIVSTGSLLTDYPTPYRRK
ncbi:hypothetical protein X777_00936 [Ooceraea biroi]|uniref:Uncharacterized protein n=1 Tax=Ooceraea biroi TaxID=2015173 RepID=A0A026WRV2_OOCBI|nr:hypothetical protein X777_00936 [Ooceraea biroi]